MANLMLFAGTETTVSCSPMLFNVHGSGSNDKQRSSCRYGFSPAVEAQVWHSMYINFANANMLP